MEIEYKSARTYKGNLHSTVVLLMAVAMFVVLMVPGVFTFYCSSINGSVLVSLDDV